MSFDISFYVHVELPRVGKDKIIEWQGTQDLAPGKLSYGTDHLHRFVSVTQFVYILFLMNVASVISVCVGFELGSFMRSG